MLYEVAHRFPGTNPVILSLEQIEFLYDGVRDQIAYDQKQSKKYG